MSRMDEADPGGKRGAWYAAIFMMSIVRQNTTKPNRPPRSSILSLVNRSNSYGIRAGILTISDKLIS